MHISIRRYKIVPGAMAQISELVQAQFVPIISEAPGFIAYYVIDTGSDTAASVNVFETQGQAEGSNRLAAAWAPGAIGHLLASPAEITAGDVKVQSVGTSR